MYLVHELKSSLIYTGKNLVAIMNMLPTKTQYLVNGEELFVNGERVRVGDHVVLRESVEVGVLSGVEYEDWFCQRYEEEVEK